MVIHKVHSLQSPTAIMSPFSLKNTRDGSFLAAEQMLERGATYCEAAATHDVPVAMLHDRVTRHKTVTRKPGRLASLSPIEEECVVSVLCRYAERGVPMRRAQLKQAIEVIVARMTPARRLALQFRNGSTGVKYLRAFQARHSHKIRFVKPTKQEAQRFRACNGDTLAKHFAVLEKIVSEHSIDPDRIWNCDECGMTPGKDANGASKQKAYVTRSGAHDAKMGQFANGNRFTMLPAVSATGDTAPPLFIFKRCKMPYRQVLQGGRVFLQTFADHLPSRSLISMREAGGGVDTANVFKWALSFVQHVKPLTNDGRKVLLVMDGYRSHISVQVLEKFHHNNVIVYALPSHTSEKTQPLDVTVFSVFKSSINEAICSCVCRGADAKWSVYDFCRMITFAYDKAFTSVTIRSGFMRSGIWPLDHQQLLSISRPASASDADTLLCVEELQKIMEAKRRECRDNLLGWNTKIAASGFVDTAQGAVLISEQALMLAREKRAKDNAKKRIAEKRAAAVYERSVERCHRMRQEAAQLRDGALRRRAALFGLSVVAFRQQLRPLWKKRLIAKQKASARRQNLA